MANYIEKYYVHLDLNRNQLKNILIDNTEWASVTAPTSGGDKGALYWDTELEHLRVWTGTKWELLSHLTDRQYKNQPILIEYIWGQSNEITANPVDSSVVEETTLTLAHIDGSFSWTNELLTDVIPHSIYGANYTPSITVDGNTIAWGTNGLALENNVLTFHNGLPSGVDTSDTIELTYYKYIGVKGSFTLGSAPDGQWGGELNIAGIEDSDTFQQAIDKLATTIDLLSPQPPQNLGGLSDATTVPVYTLFDNRFISINNSYYSLQAGTSVDNVVNSGITEIEWDSRDTEGNDTLLGNGKTDKIYANVITQNGTVWSGTFSFTTSDDTGQFVSTPNGGLTLTVSEDGDPYEGTNNSGVVSSYKINLALDLLQTVDLSNKVTGWNYEVNLYSTSGSAQSNYYLENNASPVVSFDQLYAPFVTVSNNIKVLNGVPGWAADAEFYSFLTATNISKEFYRSNNIVVSNTNSGNISNTSLVGVSNFGTMTKTDDFSNIRVSYKVPSSGRLEGDDGESVIIEHTFASGLEGWTSPNGAVISNVSGTLEVITNDDLDAVLFDFDTDIGENYKFYVKIDPFTHSDVTLRAQTVPITLIDEVTISTNGTYTLDFIATTSTTRLRIFRVDAGHLGTKKFYIDNVQLVKVVANSGGDIQFNVTGYDSINQVSTDSVVATNHYFDLYEEDASRVWSGTMSYSDIFTNVFPPAFKDSALDNDTLGLEVWSSFEASRELQKRGDKYYYPRFDYSSYTPSGPNYSTLSGLRFATWYLGLINFKSQFSIYTPDMPSLNLYGESIWIYVKCVKEDGTQSTSWLSAMEELSGGNSLTDADGKASLTIGDNGSATIRNISITQILSGLWRVYVRYVFDDTITEGYRVPEKTGNQWE